MDISLREILLSPDDIIRYQDDPSFVEGFKSNVAYVNAPFLNSVEVGVIFGDIPKDPNFKAEIPDDLLPHYKQLYHYKNEEHFNFLVQNLRASLRKLIN